MKTIIQCVILLLSGFVSEQKLDISSRLKFIEAFKTYHIQMTSTENADWSLYDERKKSFDEKLRLLIADKNTLITEYDKQLIEQERKKIKTLLDKQSGTNGSNEKLEAELLKWKKEGDFSFKQRSLLDFFEKLDFLKKESEDVSKNFDDVTTLLLFESRLEEVSELIEKL